MISSRNETFSGSLFKVGGYNANRARKGQITISSDYAGTKNSGFKLFQNAKTNDDICIQIGKENKSELIKDCSLITTTYGIDGNIIGTIGIIGPKRMEYSKVISVMNWVKKKIDEDILKMLGDI